jgi:hypothetical protein
LNTISRSQAGGTLTSDPPNRTSGKEFRQKEQLDVFSKHFPKLSKKEVKKLEKAGMKGERRKKREGGR